MGVLFFMGDFSRGGTFLERSLQTEYLLRWDFPETTALKGQLLTEKRMYFEV